MVVQLYKCTLYKCKSLNCTFKRGEFVIYELFFNKEFFNTLKVAVLVASHKSRRIFAYFYEKTENRKVEETEIYHQPCLWQAPQYLPIYC